MSLKKTLILLLILHPLVALLTFFALAAKGSIIHPKSIVESIARIMTFGAPPIWAGAGRLLIDGLEENFEMMKSHQKCMYLMTSIFMLLGISIGLVVIMV